MAAFLGNLRNVVIAGFILALGVLAIRFSFGGLEIGTEAFWAFIIRWLHIICGVMWIGLLWYFNFVATPTVPKIPENLRPALGGYITPAALFWFRWGAMFTFITGWLYLLHVAFARYGGLGPFFDTSYGWAIFTGGLLGSMMWANVWFVIWPNQQRALNIDNKYPDLDAAAKAAAGKTAMLFSRTNTLLSIPMLVAMTGAQTLG